MTGETLEKAYRQAKATMELEGFVFDEEDERDIKAVLTGQMTIEELTKKIKRGE